MYIPYMGACCCSGDVTHVDVLCRMSKGIREAPGKALIGDLAQEAGDKTEGAFSKPLDDTACMTVCERLDPASKACCMLQHQQRLDGVSVYNTPA